jgi:SNF2 family DNA or RNA helicase
VLHYADAEAWPVKTSFVDYYCERGYNMSGFAEVFGFKATRQPEFQQVFQGMTRRRLKAEVLDLPELLMGGELIRECEMSKEQATGYAQMRDELVLMAAEGKIVAQNAMIAAGRLTQLASATGYPDPDWEAEVAKVEAENAQRIAEGLPPKDLPPVKMLLKLPSGKIASVLDDIASGEFEGEQVAMSFESRRLLRLLEQAMLDAKMDPDLITSVAGDRTDAQCDQAIADFQKGSRRFLLYTYAAGGTGVTLTAASSLLRVQRSWSPILWKQGLDRVHRIGSERHGAIKVYDYVTAGTIEETQIDRNGQNAVKLEELVQDGPKLAQLLGTGGKA